MSAQRIFERSTVLKLPLPPDELQQWSVTELLLLVSAREEGCNVLVDCRSEICSLSRAEHILQRRVFTCPQVLLVHVRRTRADGTLSRFGVCVEDQISLPGCGTLVLRGVIYHRGTSADSGHYTCACLGPDRCFWYFDDIHRPTRLGANISEFRVCNVVMLVYSRPDSAVHVSRAGSVAGPLRCGVSSASHVAHSQVAEKDAQCLRPVGIPVLSAGDDVALDGESCSMHDVVDGALSLHDLRPLLSDVLQSHGSVDTPFSVINHDTFVEHDSGSLLDDVGAAVSTRPTHQLPSSGSGLLKRRRRSAE